MTSPPGQDPTLTVLILAEDVLSAPHYYRNEDGDTDFYRCPQGWGARRKAAITAIQAALRNHGQGIGEPVADKIDLDFEPAADRPLSAEAQAQMHEIDAHRRPSPIPGLSSPQGQKAEEATMSTGTTSLANAGYVAGEPASPEKWHRGWTGNTRVNFSDDAWVKVWQDKEWIIVHTRSGGVETTVSLDRYQAFDIAFALTSELAARFQRARTAEHALWQFKNISADPASLRYAADEVDCGEDCAGGWSVRCMERGNCKHAVAEDMRDFANAIERKADISQPSAPTADTGSGEGWQLVPRAMVAWLMGEGPAPDGNWFGDNERGPFSWRTRLREWLSAVRPKDGGAA